MNTSDALRNQMADLARDLQSQQTPADALLHVVNAAVELLEGCEAASISLATRTGEITTSASTSEALTRADELQIELGEGPCLAAVWEREPIFVSDLRTEDRWPRWGPRVTDELGFRSMTCVPLFTHENRVGALNLFAHAAGAFDRADVDEAMAIAAHAAVAVAAAEEISHLHLALDSRTMIGQATGLVMAYYGLSAGQGFQLLRRLSSERNVKIASIAREMVERHERERDAPLGGSQSRP